MKAATESNKVPMSAGYTHWPDYLIAIYTRLMLMSTSNHNLQIKRQRESVQFHGKCIAPLKLRNFMFYYQSYTMSQFTSRLYRPISIRSRYHYGKAVIFRARLHLTSTPKEIAGTQYLILLKDLCALSQTIRAALLTAAQGEPKQYRVLRITPFSIAKLV